MRRYCLGYGRQCPPAQACDRDFERHDLDGSRLVDIGVETTPIGDARAILIAVDGELDLSTCEQLKPAADEAVFGRRPLILDLSRCTFIDSSGLRLVLQIANGLAECEGAGLSMAIVAGESGTRKMFSLTAIDRKVPLFDSRDEALAWLGGKAKPSGDSGQRECVRQDEVNETEGCGNGDAKH